MDRAEDSWLVRSRLNLVAIAATLMASVTQAQEVGSALPARNQGTLVLVPVDRTKAQLEKMLPATSSTRAVRTFDPVANSAGSGTQLFSTQVGDRPTEVEGFSREDLRRSAVDIDDLLKSQTGRGSLLDTVQRQVWSKGGAFEAAGRRDVLSGGPITGAQARLSNAEQGAATFKMLENRGVAIDPAFYTLLPKSETVQRAADSGRAEGETFAASYITLSAALVALHEAPGDPERVRAFEEQAPRTHDAFVESWPEIVERPELRRLAVSIMDSLAEVSDLKAVYGRRTRFQAQSYNTIYQRREHVAGIWLDGIKPICSGVALNAQWVLTAGHCFKNAVPSSATVSFSADGPRQRIVAALPKDVPGDDAADTIDFVLLKVDPAGATRADDPGKTSPICWRREHPGRHEPVIVVALENEGGAGAVSTFVYDGATLLYPFRADTRQFREISAMAGIRITKAAIRLHPADIPMQDRYFDRQYADFLQAYRADGDGNHEQRSTHGGSSARPEMGFDTDTVHGNSGAPVLSRTDGCLLGIYTGGQPDERRFGAASWNQHEFATPISEAVAYLRAAALSAGPEDHVAISEVLQLLDELPAS